MSFSLESRKLVKDLIQAEYKNACEKFGEKYHSLHEGYAILKEEMIKQIKESLQRSKMFIALGAFESLVIENEQLKQQINKMKCCGNCKHCDSDNPCRFHRENRQCDNYVFWELAE